MPGDLTRRICIAANTTWYLHNFRSRLITSLIDDGYSVMAISPSDGYVDRLAATGARHVHLELDNAGVNPARELLTLWRITALLNRHRPAAILTYTPKINIYFSLAARLLRIPVVANVSGLGHSFGSGGWLELLVRRLYRVALGYPARVFFQNEEDRSEFVRSGMVRQSRSERLPGSGVDVDRFRPREKALGTREFVFLLPARMLWEKGIREFVDAARRIRASERSTRFFLVGFLDVENPSAIPRDVVATWQKEGVVEYLGVSDDMPELYSTCDCVVLPSYYREGVPRSLLEAASMGKPVITADTPGCRDAVEDGVTGFICRPRDVDHLEECMRRMLGMSGEERHRMGRAGRERMLRHFDERAVVEKYTQLINSLLRPAAG